jgi:hypothetical protein
MYSRLRFVLVLMVLACTPGNFRVAPYDRNPFLAKNLSLHAAGMCVERRGGGPMPPHPFTSEGCSLWPDFTWVDCCIKHDMAYWCGGPAADRKKADDALGECVAQHSSASMGSLMEAGVRLGGVPWLPFPWRWGYGWDGIRGYE